MKDDKILLRQKIKDGCTQLIEIISKNKKKGIENRKKKK